jgi:hypothetical protein
MQSGLSTAFCQVLSLGVGVFVMTDTKPTCGDQSGRHPGFLCFKTFRPIHYGQRWFRQALVISALDRNVMRMGPCPMPPHRLPAGVEFSFWAQTKEFSQLVLVSQEHVDTRPISSIMTTRVVYRFELSRHPAAAFSKAIWACKRLVLGHSEHYALVRIATRHPSGIQLEEMVAQAITDVGGDFDARIRELYGLIANGYLETDISWGMRPDTLIYPGPLLAEDWRLPPTRAAQDGGQLELFAPTLR